MEEFETIPVELSNGQIMFVQATRVPLADPEERVLDLPPGPFHFGQVLEVVEGFSKDLGELLVRASPQKATVEFGVEVAADTGKLTALLVKGGGKANLKITLEWTKPTSGPTAT